MKCDSWASFLACTFASPCLGHEPKARVATIAFEALQGFVTIWRSIVLQALRFKNFEIV
jgi:hypothetical protein